MAPPVHIIIVNWNGWRDTLDCLASLEELDYPNYEIVVVDNGSTDESVARIEEAFPSVTLLQTGKNLGFAGGSNAGIKYALERRADYVWLLNNDTTVAPNALGAMIAVASREPGVGAVGSVLYWAGERDRVQAYGGGWIGLSVGMSRQFITPVTDDRLSYLTGASLLLRRDTLEKVGLLDESFFMYWEDSDYAFRIRGTGLGLAVARESRVWHKESAALGAKRSILDGYFNASAVRFFKKHSPLPILPVCIGVGGRLAKRLIRRDWERAGAVWRAALTAWREG